MGPFKNREARINQIEILKILAFDILRKDVYRP